METDTTLVWANDVVVLDAVTHVGLYVTLVVNPRNAELNNAIWNAEALNEVGLVKLWMLVVLLFNRWENLTNCLDVLRLIRNLCLRFSITFCAFIFSYSYCLLL